MDFDFYQQQASTTAMYPKELGLYYVALGLGEAGEIQNKVKKILRDDEGVLTEKRQSELVAELGDLLWYVAMMAKELGAPLSAIAQTNLDKLFSRKKRGVITGEGDSR